MVHFISLNQIKTLIWSKIKRIFQSNYVHTPRPFIPLHPSHFSPSSCSPSIPSPPRRYFPPLPPFLLPQSHLFLFPPPLFPLFPLFQLFQLFPLFPLFQLFTFSFFSTTSISSCPFPLDLPFPTVFIPFFSFLYPSIPQSLHFSAINPLLNLPPSFIYKEKGLNFWMILIIYWIPPPGPLLTIKTFMQFS